jgi:hypothetical protein
VSKPDLLSILQQMPHHTPVFLSDAWYALQELYPVQGKIYTALQPTSIMEIGAFMGAGIIAALYDTPSIQEVYWVDNESSQNGSNTYARQNIEYGCHALQRPCPPIKCWTAYPPAEEAPRLDIVFVDGDHEYESVIRDLEYAMTLKPTYICGHDFRLTISGVERAVREFCVKYKLPLIEVSMMCGGFVIPLHEDPKVTRAKLESTGIITYFNKRRAIATFAKGPGLYRQMLEVSMPLFCRYGARHGYDVIADHTHTGNRPASWYKVPMAKELLQGPYESVLWLDADLVIVDGREDLDELVYKDRIQGMVSHHCGLGWVPNCGMWFMRRAILPLLDEVWSHEEHINHFWWEQAGMHACLGIDPAAPGAVEMSKWNEYYRRTNWLPYEWNVHPLDARGMPDKVKIYHASCCQDRLGVMRSWAAKATW